MQLLFIFLIITSCVLLLPGCWQNGTTENVSGEQSMVVNNADVERESASIDLATNLNGMTGAEALQALLKEGNVVVDFFAVWCPPCKQMHPIVDALADEYTPRLKFVKIDVDKFPDLAQGIKIGETTIHANNGIPQFYFFKDGMLQKEIAGGMPKEQLKAEIDRIYFNN